MPALPASTPTTSTPSRPRRTAGFTLIELMICVAVVGILSSVAYPAFSSTLVGVRRSEALVALMTVQVQQERFRADHLSYGTLSQIGLSSTSSARHYEVTMLDYSSTGYAVRASALGGQQRDTSCRHLRLTVDGLNVAYASGATDATDNAPAINRRCWSL